MELKIPHLLDVQRTYGAVQTKMVAKLCQRCQSYFGDAQSSYPCDDEACSLCLDLWDESVKSRLTDTLRQACEPYGSFESNRFSFQTPATISIPGDIRLRWELTCVGKQPKKEFSEFQQNLKSHLRSHLVHHLQKHQGPELEGYPHCVTNEEQGHLSVHLVVVQTLQLPRPQEFRPSLSKKTRKRFRGNDPTLKQGGDPLANLQRRLSKSGHTIWSIPEVETCLTKTRSLETLLEWFGTQSTPKNALDMHFVVARRPFYVKAMYTKSRRDVSQSPFYVPDEKVGGMKKLGVSSVDEEITSVVAAAAGGMSKLNNSGDDDEIVYGLAKFHASGREDMDVRMLLPPEPTPGVGGRPFVCEVIDALRLPTPLDLQGVVQKINQTPEAGTVHQNRYGNNAIGVGISDCLAFTPKASFKNLQADTEDKVKYYGCLCWSKDPIPSEEYLRDKLAKCPIALQQRTPLRVLHRRSNAVRSRRVLTLKATRIDHHYFRLNISTEAGTYVKEFVHGDLGRTQPSVSSLLGSKTDILELDCEGIKL